MFATKEDAETPGMLFHALNRAHVNLLQAELSRRGLSDVGSPLILFILDHHGDRGEIASQRELAQQLHVSPATIAKSVKSLERLGYVEKRPDEADNRRNRIAITGKGAAAVKQCFEVFRQVDERMTQGLTPEERAELDRLQRKMLHNLGANGKGRCCPC